MKTFIDHFIRDEVSKDNEALSYLKSIREKIISEYMPNADEKHANLFHELVTLLGDIEVLIRILKFEEIAKKAQKIAKEKGLKPEDFGGPWED